MEALADPLCIIFNKSFNSGIIPQDWRNANITPIFKKGSKADPGNYRPISLTSIICKIMESIVKDRVVEHLERHYLINSSQHGFMKRKSCLTNLLEFFETVTKEFDKGSPFDIIYLDLAKAFDKVPHKQLIQKLEAYGISGQTLNWIENWLSDRKQRVVLNGDHSDWKKVLSGVPQGSVLGPLLFVIFIDDIDSAADLISIINKFADDTKLGQVILSDKDRETLQNCLNDICKWANDWGMTFNIGKCHVVHVGRTNPKYTYHMNGMKLEVSEHERDLGVKIHCSLKPSKQCSEAAHRANTVLGQISRSFHYRDRFVFVNLYKQYVRPHLEYCAPAWAPWTVTDINCIEKVQERAVRMISGLRSKNYYERLKELNLQTLKDRRIRADMIQTFKIQKGIDNVPKTTWFSNINQTRVTRLTYETENLQPVYARTDVRRNFFSVRSVNLWNKLPTELKHSDKIGNFKKNYDQYICRGFTEVTNQFT